MNRLRSALHRPLVAAFLIVSLSVSTGASAQWTGSRIGKNAKRTNPAEVMQIAAACVAKRGPKYAFEVMDTLPGSEEEFLLISRNEGDIGNCMSKSNVAVGNWEMSFVARSFRRALAQELVLVQLRKEIDVSEISKGHSWFLDAVASSPNGANGDLPYLSYMDFGDCVVAAAPAPVIDLVESEPNSAEESRAVQDLMPFLGSCLGKGQELKLSTDSFRMAVTEPLYHRIRRIEGEN